MPSRLSMAILPLLALLASCLVTGCASVTGTTVYYTPYTANYYPPKSPQTPIPILAKRPDRPYVAIGRLAFASDLGWPFLQKSMVYNAQINGADAVILKSTGNWQQSSVVQVPPQVNWVPSGGFVRGRCGRVYAYNSWVPVFSPGYVQPYVDNITSIDAEMIVFKK